MSLRNIMIELVDEFFAKGNEATERRSWIEARVYHDAGNALLEKLGMPTREVGNGSADQ